jgi:hypothetical protein
MTEPGNLPKAFSSRGCARLVVEPSAFGFSFKSNISPSLAALQSRLVLSDARLLQLGAQR